MKENELRDTVEERLSHYFFLYPEVYLPQVSGRLDLLAQNKQNPNIIFGVEFKSNEKKTGFQLAAWCKQMEVYSRADKFIFTPGSVAEKKPIFESFPREFAGKIPILACPPISHNYFVAAGVKVDSNTGKKLGCEFHPYNHDHSNINSFLSAGFNVGELRPEMRGGKWVLRAVYANRVMWRDWGVYDGEPLGETISKSYYEMNMKAINKFHHE